MRRKEAAPPPQDHLRGLKSAVGSHGEKGGVRDTGQQAPGGSLLFRTRIFLVLKLECP